MTMMMTAAEVKLPAVVRTDAKRPKFYRIMGVQAGSTDAQLWAWGDDASSKPGHESLGRWVRSHGQYAWSVAEIAAKLASGKLVAVEAA